MFEFFATYKYINYNIHVQVLRGHLTNGGWAVLQVLVRQMDFNPWTRGEGRHLDNLQNLHHSCTISAALNAICSGIQVGSCHDIVHVELLQSKELSRHLESGQMPSEWRRVKWVNGNKSILTLLVLNCRGWGHLFGPDQKGAPELVSWETVSWYRKTTNMHNGNVHFPIWVSSIFRRKRYKIPNLCPDMNQASWLMVSFPTSVSITSTTESLHLRLLLSLSFHWISSLIMTFYSLWLRK